MGWIQALGAVKKSGKSSLPDDVLSRWGGARGVPRLQELWKSLRAHAKPTQNAVSGTDPTELDDAAFWFLETFREEIDMQFIPAAITEIDDWVKLISKSLLKEIKSVTQMPGPAASAAFVQRLGSPKTNSRMSRLVIILANSVRHLREKQECQNSGVAAVCVDLVQAFDAYADSVHSVSGSRSQLSDQQSEDQDELCQQRIGRLVESVCASSCCAEASLSSGDWAQLLQLGLARQLSSFPPQAKLQKQIIRSLHVAIEQGLNASTLECICSDSVVQALAWSPYKTEDAQEISLLVHYNNLVGEASALILTACRRSVIHSNKLLDRLTSMGVLQSVASWVPFALGQLPEASVMVANPSGPSDDGLAESPGAINKSIEASIMFASQSLKALLEDLPLLRHGAPVGAGPDGGRRVVFPEALSVIRRSFIESSNDAVKLALLDIILSVLSAHTENFEAVRTSRCLLSACESLDCVGEATRESIVKTVEYCCTALSAKPHAELAALVAVLRSTDHPHVAVPIVRLITKLVTFDGEFKEIFREAGGIGALIELCKRRVGALYPFALRNPAAFPSEEDDDEDSSTDGSPGLQTNAISLSSDSSSGPRLLCDADARLKVFTALSHMIESCPANVEALQDCDGRIILLVLIRDDLCREHALNIICSCISQTHTKEDDQANVLLEILQAAPTRAIQLRTDVLNALRKMVASSAHVHRRFGETDLGVNSAIASLASLSEAAAEDAESKMSLSLAVFRFLGALMAGSSSNRQTFRTVGAESLGDALKMACPWKGLSDGWQRTLDIILCLALELPPPLTKHLIKPGAGNTPYLFLHSAQIVVVALRIAKTSSPEDVELTVKLIRALAVFPPNSQRLAAADVVGALLRHTKQFWTDYPEIGRLSREILAECCCYGLNPGGARLLLSAAGIGQEAGFNQLMGITMLMAASHAADGATEIVLPIIPCDGSDTNAAVASSIQYTGIRPAPWQSQQGMSLLMWLRMDQSSRMQFRLAGFGVLDLPPCVEMMVTNEGRIAAIWHGRRFEFEAARVMAGKWSCVVLSAARLRLGGFLLTIFVDGVAAGCEKVGSAVPIPDSASWFIVGGQVGAHLQQPPPVQGTAVKDPLQLAQADCIRIGPIAMWTDPMTPAAALFCFAAGPRHDSLWAADSAFSRQRQVPLDALTPHILQRLSALGSESQIGMDGGFPTVGYPSIESLVFVSSGANVFELPCEPDVDSTMSLLSAPRRRLSLPGDASLADAQPEVIMPSLRIVSSIMVGDRLIEGRAVGPVWCLQHRSLAQSLRPSGGAAALMAILQCCKESPDLVLALRILRLALANDAGAWWDWVDMNGCQQIVDLLRAQPSLLSTDVLVELLSLCGFDSDKREHSLIRSPDVIDSLFLSWQIWQNATEELRVEAVKALVVCVLSNTQRWHNVESVRRAGGVRALCRLLRRQDVPDDCCEHLFSLIRVILADSYQPQEVQALSDALYGAVHDPAPGAAIFSAAKFQPPTPHSDSGSSPMPTASHHQLVFGENGTPHSDRDVLISNGALDAALSMLPKITNDDKALDHFSKQFDFALAFASMGPDCAPSTAVAALTMLAAEIQSRSRFLARFREVDGFGVLKCLLPAYADTPAVFRTLFSLAVGCPVIKLQSRRGSVTSLTDSISRLEDDILSPDDLLHDCACGPDTKIASSDALGVLLCLVARSFELKHCMSNSAHQGLKLPFANRLLLSEHCTERAQLNALSVLHALFQLACISEDMRDRLAKGELNHSFTLLCSTPGVVKMDCINTSNGAGKLSPLGQSINPLNNDQSESGGESILSEDEEDSETELDQHSFDQDLSSSLPNRPSGIMESPTLLSVQDSPGGNRANREPVASSLPSLSLSSHSSNISQKSNSKRKSRFSLGGDGGPRIIRDLLKRGRESSQFVEDLTSRVKSSTRENVGHVLRSEISRITPSSCMLNLEAEEQSLYDQTAMDTEAGIPILRLMVLSICEASMRGAAKAPLLMSSLLDSIPDSSGPSVMNVLQSKVMCGTVHVLSAASVKALYGQYKDFSHAAAAFCRILVDRIIAGVGVGIEQSALEFMVDVVQQRCPATDTNRMGSAASKIYKYMQRCILIVLTSSPVGRKIAFLKAIQEHRLTVFHPVGNTATFLPTLCMCLFSLVTDGDSAAVKDMPAQSKDCTLLALSVWKSLLVLKKAQARQILIHNPAGEGMFSSRASKSKSEPVDWYENGFQRLIQIDVSEFLVWLTNPGTLQGTRDFFDTHLSGFLRSHVEDFIQRRESLLKECRLRRQTSINSVIAMHSSGIASSARLLQHAAHRASNSKGWVSAYDLSIELTLDSSKGRTPHSLATYDTASEGTTRVELAKMAAMGMAWKRPDVLFQDAREGPSRARRRMLECVDSQLLSVNKGIDNVRRRSSLASHNSSMDDENEIYAEDEDRSPFAARSLLRSSSLVIQNQTEATAATDFSSSDEEDDDQHITEHNDSLSRMNESGFSDEDDDDRRDSRSPEAEGANQHNDDAEHDGIFEQHHGAALLPLILGSQRGKFVKAYNVDLVWYLGTRQCIFILGTEGSALLQGFRLSSDGTPVPVHDSVGQADDSVAQNSQRVLYLEFGNIITASKRRYLQQDIAIELFFQDQVSLLLVCEDIKSRRKVMEIIDRGRRRVRASPPATEEHEDTWTAAKALLLGKSEVQRLWCQGKMSNFDYIMSLNTLSGRSFSDLHQYPVFPWVIKDFESSTLDLNNPESFRDFSKPVGIQDPLAEEALRARYEDWDESTGVPKYHFGSHYSTAGVVLNFLIRMEPFTTQAVHFQGGRLDHADRLFRSISDSWRQAASAGNQGDVRELTPEFFNCPTFLECPEWLHLGQLQTGEEVKHVELPPWAGGSARRFIELHRAALESPYTTAHLHEWVDLVFGFKQKGPAAVEAVNVYHHLTYEGAVNLNTIEDEAIRSATLAQIKHFGQTPRQLFRRPHPRAALVLLTPDLTECPHMLQAEWVRATGKPAGHALYVGDRHVIVVRTLMALPPNGDKALSFRHTDGSVRCLTSGVEPRTFAFHSRHIGAVTALAISHDGTIVATGGYDGIVTVWKMPTSSSCVPWQVISSSLKHSFAVCALAVTSMWGVVVSGDVEGGIVAADMHTGVPLFAPKPLHCRPVSICLGLASTTVIVASTKSVQIMDISGQQISAVDVVSMHLPLVTFASVADTCHTPLGKYALITGHEDGSIRVWTVEWAEESLYSKKETPQGDQAQEFNADQNGKNDPSSSPLILLPEVTCRAVLLEHQRPISAIACAGVKRMVSADEGGGVVEWTLPTTTDFLARSSI